jgi:hypothetical protein
MPTAAAETIVREDPWEMSVPAILDVVNRLNIFIALSYSVG